MMTRNLLRGALLTAVSAVSISAAQAALVTIPNSSLLPTTQLYTDRIGGGIGNVLVTTGGGSNANVGAANGRNDDGYTGPINLGYSLNFFGGTYTQFWVNNNGNVSFGGGISSFTPDGPQGASQPIISPFFADVDTRAAQSGVTHLRQDAGQNIVTWDNVGYYDTHGDLLNNFQLVLRSATYAIPTGEGQIGFFWTTMGWETGDASGGTGGFGGTPAAVGFGDGLGNGSILAGSTEAGIANIVRNHYVWFNLDNSMPVVAPPTNPTPTPTPVPEPGTLLLMGAGLLGLGLARRKRAAR